MVESELIKRIDEVICYLAIEENFTSEELDKLEALQSVITNNFVELIKHPNHNF